MTKRQYTRTLQPKPLDPCHSASSRANFCRHWRRLGSRPQGQPEIGPVHRLDSPASAPVHGRRGVIRLARCCSSVRIVPTSLTRRTASSIWEAGLYQDISLCGERTARVTQFHEDLVDHAGATQSHHKSQRAESNSKQTIPRSADATGSPAVNYEAACPKMRP
jgi:hypothetical protein